MSENEIRDLLKLLEEQGWCPEWCDTPVPYYDSPIMCGEPTLTHENRPDEIILPKDMISMQPVFTILAKGDSMVDAGIAQGDILKITCVDRFYDGDIVLASIDDQTTIKTYCKDEEGTPWLVPQNSEYAPINLEQKDNARIIGRVDEIIKRAPRISYRECMRIIRKSKTDNSGVIQIAPETVAQAIRQIAPMIRIARQWYAVYRVLADRRLVGEEDYGAFVTMVTGEVAQHGHLPTVLELQRLAVQSFRKPVGLWRSDNAPVRGKRFNDYLAIARRTEKLLGL